ncbi:NADH-quinone oxidoreductase subunit M [bacterium HR15]|nr:NADH-quinone oxidoreductase subunit M [bacterium HR15]
MGGYNLAAMEWAVKVLSWTLWTPLIGVFLLLLIPRGQRVLACAVAIAATLTTLGLTGVLVVNFDPSTTGYQFVERVPWLPDYGIAYLLGIDGISLWLVVLTAVLSVLAVVYVTLAPALPIGSNTPSPEHTRAFLCHLLLLETALMGVFMALDLVLFYVFFELTLVPTYFLIALWGGERRGYAALKFFLYTFFGSLFMLLAALWLAFIHYRATNEMTFELMRLQQFVAEGGVPLDVQKWLFLGFALAFAVKLPLVPFHTWWPVAMGEAPIPVVVIFLKTGAYAFLRFGMPLFPEAAQVFAPLGMALAAVAVVYAAITATMQFDMKRVALYAVVSHAGFIMMGLFALNQTGLVGSVVQQLNHGVTMGAMFLLLGMLHWRTRTLEINQLGGLKAQMPLFSALFLMVMLALVALPGTNGFIGEFLCLLGAYQAAHSGQVATLWVVLGATGTILSVVYMLWMFQRVFYGPTPERLRSLPDLTPAEAALVLPLVALIFWIGLRPAHFTHSLEQSATQWVQQVASEPWRVAHDNSE